MIFFIPVEVAYVLIGLIFSLAIYLTYKNVYKAFLGVLFLMPLMHKELFSLVIWDLLPIRIFVLGMALILGVKSLLYLKKEGFEKAYKYVLNDPFLMIFGALWFFRLLSIYNSTEVQRSFFLLAFFSLTLVIYLAYKSIIKADESRFFHLTKFYLFVGFLTEVFAVVQYYLRLCCRETVGAVWVIPGFTPRLGSSFWDVNHYGAFLITLIPLIFNFMVVSKKIKLQIMYFLFLMLSVWLLFMTQSRSAWIGLFVGSMVTLLIYFWTTLKKALLITGAGLLVSLIGFIAIINIMNIDIQDKFADYMHHRLDSTDTHFMLLTAASEIFYNNFFFGSGYGTFDSAFRETETATDYFDREPKLKESLVPSHSIWGEILGEGGAIGITLYASLMILIVASMIYIIKVVKADTARYLGIGLLGGLISILTSGLFYSYNMEFYWIFLFMCIGYIFVASDFKVKLLEIIQWWGKLSITPYLIIVPAAIFFIFINLGETSLIDYDEAIYAKVAKNIILTGDWATLRWNDLNTYWFEKPPLYMWFTALLFKLTGFGEFAARFTSAIAGFTGIIVVYLFGKKLYNKTAGLISSLIMISVVHYIYYSRNGMLDVTVTMFILTSLYFFYEAINSRKHNLKYYLISGLMIGLAIMTKSIIGLLPLVIICVYLLTEKIFIDRKAKIPFKGLALIGLGVIITAAPWHLYSYYLHGKEFIDEYLLEHVFKRGLTGLGHKAPLLWYLEVIKVSFRIWILALIPGLVSLPFIDKDKRKSFILLVLSITIIFVFFSSSEDKLQWYIMPIYPFLALIAGRFIERFFIIANNLIKKDYSLKPFVLRSILLFGTFAVSVFYLAWNKDKVYYPDFSKDKVALIKIFNEKFPIQEYPDRKLYYYNISEPVLLFYSDHKIKGVREDNIYDIIEDGEPNEHFSFLTTSSLYYKVRDSLDEVNFPLMLDTQGSAGDWVLFRNRSRVEVLRFQLITLQGEQTTLLREIGASTPTSLQNSELLRIRNEITSVIDQLNAYGYPPTDLIQ